MWLQTDGGREDFERLYSIGEKIGEGGFGQVFKCKDLHSPRGEDGAPLCVKIVPLHGRHSPRVARLCEDEKRELLYHLFRMEHPNLVHYHRFVQTGEALYTVMDRCCGPDLVDYVAGNKDQLPIDVVRSLGTQILLALVAVHAVGIMHRDVKPENFRFRDATTDTLQLLDFGFAKPSGAAPGQHTVTGTLLYAAPEVFDGFYSCSCDLWSAGVVLFQLFSGEPPFATSDVGILRSLHRDPVLAGDALFRGAGWEAVPVSAKHLVRGLLTVDVGARLTAAEASEHAWLSGAAAEPASPVQSALRRCSDSIAELKRTYFVWNLADGGDSDSEADAAG